MVRWKRNHKNKWYYLPIVFPTKQEAIARTPNTKNDYYRIEVVEISPTKVWSTNDKLSPVPSEELEPTVPGDG